MSTVKWGSPEQVMRVHESLLNLHLDQDHGALACPVGHSPTEYPPPFPVVVTATPIRSNVISDGEVVDLYYWVKQEAWDEAGF